MPFEAKLIFVTMPASKENIAASARFYSHIFGLDFSRTWTDEVKVYYAPISIDGTYFGVEYRRNEPWELERKPFPVIAVDKLEVCIKELTELGGKQIGEPFELPLDDLPLDEDAGAKEWYFDFLISNGMHPGQLTNRLGVMVRMADPAGNVINLLQPDPHCQYAYRTGLYRIGITHAQWEKWQNEVRLAETMEHVLGEDIRADRESGLGE